MTDLAKTKKQLIDELRELRQRVAELGDIQVRLKNTEGALRESEERSRLITESIDEVFWMSTLDIKEIIYVSPSYEKLWGRTCQSAYDAPLSFTEAIHPEDQERVAAAVEEHAKGDWDLEYRIVRPDGTVRWIQDRGFPIRDESRNLQLMTGVARDITKTKEAEEALKQSHDDLERKVQERTAELMALNDQLLHEIAQRKRAERHIAEAHEFNETILAASPVGITTYKSDGQCVSANEAMARVVGATREQLLKQNFRQIEPWKQSGLLSDAEEVLSTGVAKQREVHLVTTFGKETWVNCQFARLTYGGEPHLLLTVGDVSELKQAEAELRASEKKYRELAELLPQLVYELDDRGFVTFLNEAGSRMTGYCSEDISKGLNIREVFPPEDLDRILQDFSSALQGEPPQGREYPVRKKDGGTILMVVYSSPVREDHRIVGLRGVAVDISERKKSEETIRQQSEFLRIVLESLTHPFCVINSGDYTVSPANSATIPASYSGETTCYALFHGRSEPCNISEHPCPVEEVKRTKKPVTLEHVHYDKDGTARYVEIHAYPIFDTEGNVSEVIRYSLDVTDRKHAEEALLQSERMLSTILDTSPVGIALSKQRKMDWVNEAFRDMFGFKEEHEYLGQDARILYPSDEEYIRAGKVLYRDLETGTVAETDVELRRKDGSVMYGHVRLRALDALDPAKGVILALSDISFRKQTEIELEKLALIVQNASEFIALSDLDERLIFINEAGARMVGISKEEVGQYAILDFVPESYQDVVKTDIIPEISEKDHWEGFLQLRNVETGKLIDVQAMTFLIRDPGTKQPLYMANVSLDITERRQTEERLRESEQRYRSVFEQSTDGVYVTTRDGKFVEANQSLLEIYGLSREDLLAVNVADLYVDPDGRAKFQEEIERRGHVKDYPVKLRRKDGKEIDCLLSASLWNDESGQILGYQGILRDVTESKQLEAQLRQAQKMESLGTMAGGIAHDFNNLLTVILGYSDLLLASKTEQDPDYEDLQKILAAAGKGADLVKRILTFSRKMESSRRPIDLNHELQQSKKLLERTIPKMIAIDLHLAEDLKRVNADRGQIEQALLNLAVNAQHAMPDGGTLTLETENVTLDEEYCRTHLEAEPGEYVVLSISDTGHGMEQEVLEHIFEPFYTTKTPGEGTGLGLAMVYGIVKGHGGRISCYSEPGHGTTFKIYFLAIEKETGPTEAAREEMIKGGTETILLVDDEEFVRELGKRILSQFGYKVLTAENGQKALEVYQSKKDDISLVILDLIMPEMGGKECLEELLKIDPQAKVLVASGFFPNGPTKGSVEAGAKGFVGKPFKVKQLLQMVRKVLDEN